MDTSKFYSTKASLFTGTSNNYVSPASFYGNRVSIPSEYLQTEPNIVFVASENKIYQASVAPLPSEAVIPAAADTKDTPPPISTSLTQSLLTQSNPHRGEIHNLHWSSTGTGGALLSVDSLGVGLIHHFTANGREKTGEVLLKPSTQTRELGSASIAHSPATDTVLSPFFAFAGPTNALLP